MSPWQKYQEFVKLKYRTPPHSVILILKNHLDQFFTYNEGKLTMNSLKYWDNIGIIIKLLKICQTLVVQDFVCVLVLTLAKDRKFKAMWVQMSKTLNISCI